MDIAINNMAEVATYSAELNALGHSWDLLKILGQMSGGSTDMTTTQERFRKLADELVQELSKETLRVAVQDLAAKATGIIGILNRNLFERTADIGFLATDNDVRAFLQAHYSAPDTTESGANVEVLRVQLARRFADYVAKYSVYSDVVLLDREGHVVARLDQNNPVTHSSDPLLAQTLAGGKDYVETFRETDLFPDAGKTLLYSCRVTSPDNASTVLGVLCSCFRFEDEMQAIFARLLAPEDWQVLTLLDERGNVIASSSPYQAPLGVAVEMALDDEYRITRFAGQRYLAKTVAATAYQGYRGLGWYGHVMVPLAVAFESNEVAAREDFDQALLENVFENSHIFAERIRGIPKQAQMIQANLDRTVWNGNIFSTSDANPALKVLLREISNAGLKTKAIFDKAIANLQRKVVSSQLVDVARLADTAIDIMDRNLYERANDCRWWALTPDFRRILGTRDAGSAGAAQLERILRYINSLYTVYSLLLVYDRHGRIVAGSRPEAQAFVGQSIDASWVRQALGLRSMQHYAVSGFEASTFYNDKPTYIYTTPIFAEDQPSLAVGGIAIVFDSEPQFRTMLQDCLPRDVAGSAVPGAFGLFVDERKTVIASSNERFKAGDKLALEFDYAQAEAGCSLVTLDGHHYAVGIKTSSGYREFKSQGDCYRNTVHSLVFLDLGEVRSTGKRKVPEVQAMRQSLQHSKHGSGTEVATFSIADRSFGIKTASIVEALENARLAPIPNSPGSVLGSLFYKGKPILVMNPYKALGCAPDLKADNLQIVVMNTDVGTTGIVVEKLGETFRVEPRQVDADTYTGADSDGCVEEIVTLDHEDDDAPLLVLLNPSRLVRQLMVV
jgi:chemotaxis signal transduction protein